MFSSGSKTVDQVGQLNIEGNVIPTTWFSKITYDNGKPDFNAIVILSEIVYWYRPKVVRDEASGRTLGVTKKFKSDMLQRSYDSFANQFGLSNRQVKYAIDRLCNLGILEREFRTINTEKTTLYNVIFLDINVQKLAEISLYTPLHLNVPPTSECNTPLHSDIPPPIFECNTYTENTTENTIHNINNECCSKKEQNKKSDIQTENLDLISNVLDVWKPDLNILNAWLQRSGLSTMNQTEVEELLLDVNSHYMSLIQSGRLTHNQMYSKFVSWIKRDSTKYKTKGSQTSKNNVSFKSNHQVNSNYEVDHNALAPVKDFDREAFDRQMGLTDSD